MKRIILLIYIALLPLSLLAAENSPTLAEWQRAAQNPLSPHYSLPIEYKYHGNAPAGSVHIGSFGAIMPARFDGWDIISQFTLNIMGTPGDITGIKGIPEPYVGTGGYRGSEGYAAGLADSFFTSYFVPRMGGNFSLGVGAAIVLPTDEPSRELGSGKFSIGPAVMAVYQPKNWTLSLQAQQIWSVLGSAGRNNVSQMIIKPTINYNLANGWYLLSNMEVIANWNSVSAQRWTVPVGGGVGKVFAVAGNAIDARVESYYNAVTPDQGSAWSINASFSFIFGN